MHLSNSATHAIIEALKSPNLDAAGRAALVAALSVANAAAVESVRSPGRRRAAPRVERKGDSRRLTRESIAAEPLPESGERYLYDEICPQLAVRLRPGGRTFIVVMWDRERRRAVKHTLGKVENLAPEQARRKAQEIVARVAGGEDVRPASVESMTVSELIARWHAEKSKSLRTADEMMTKATDYVAHLAGRPVVDVRREDIGDIHHFIATRARRRVLRRVGDSVKHVEIGNPGIPATADKWLAIMSSVYGWAVKKGLLESNPCVGIGKAFNAKESARSTYLHGDALLRFWKALHADPDKDVRDVLLLALYTGQRKGNVLAMRWSHVDLAAGLWTIPSGETKQKKAQTNPLSNQAVEILKRREADALGVWVFPAAHGSSFMTNSRPRDAWIRICQAACIQDLRIHDLRHTAGSWLARLGANEAVRQKALGHQTAAMAARYSHLELDPVAEAMQRMGNAISAAARPLAELKAV